MNKETCIHSKGKDQFISCDKGHDMNMRKDAFYPCIFGSKFCNDYQDSLDAAHKSSIDIDFQDYLEPEETTNE